MYSSSNILVHFVITVCFLVTLTACGTLKNGRGWGQDVTILPGWRQIGDAAINATTAPQTWVPLAGALVLQVGDMDKRLSNWASNHTPLFGSNHAAHDASSFFSEPTGYAYIVTMLATPSGDNPESWAIAKLKGFAVGKVAISASNTTTNYLKRKTKRTRPDGSDDLSFPSLTTSNAAVNATLASHNLDSCNIDEGARTAAKYGLFTLTTLTAWSRIEAKEHYPSDVLVGAALGYFYGTFFNDAFLGLNKQNDVNLIIEPAGNGFVIRMMWSF
jgi:hypothetical protein